MKESFNCTETIYNFSRCYCKIVLCWYVDSLERRLRNYVKKLIFKVYMTDFFYLLHQISPMY